MFLGQDEVLLVTLLRRCNIGASCAFPLPFSLLLLVLPLMLEPEAPIASSIPNDRLAENAGDESGVSSSISPECESRDWA